MVHETYMRRCIDLASRSGPNVMTNPNVGAVLVYDGRIIGEGWHKKFGGDHAEVEAVKSVKKEERHLIKDAALYVTLEPCNHEGKTPACTNLIVKNEIKEVIIGTLDPNPKMSGRSVAILEAKGINITSGILESECKDLIEPFRINILEKRPYVTIKFAQSEDLFISKKGEQTWLTNKFSKIESHQLRAANNAILIGTNTAIIDNPSLTNRLFPGSNPLRIVLDRSNKIPANNLLLSDKYPTLIISEHRRKDLQHQLKEQWILKFDDNLISRLLQWLYLEKNIGKLIVEGGTTTIKGFLDQLLWDEALIFRTKRIIGSGIKAPNIEGRLIEKKNLQDDELIKIKKMV